MRKFYIYPDGALKREAQWWTNFRLDIGKSEWPGEALKKKYNAVLVVNRPSDMPFVLPYVEFATEADAAAFLLRYA